MKYTTDYNNKQIIKQFEHELWQENIAEKSTLVKDIYGSLKSKINYEQQLHNN